MNPKAELLPLSLAAKPLSKCVALLMLLAMPACRRTIDMAAIDRSIREHLLAQLELPVASVECPQETRIAKAGDTFPCTVTPLVGGKLTVTVTQQDDQGNVTWEVTETEGLLDLRELATGVTEGLKAQVGLEAAVDCPGRWRASTPGDTFDCQATAADGQPITIEVTITDTEGNVSWRTR